MVWHLTEVGTFIFTVVSAKGQRISSEFQCSLFSTLQGRAGIKQIIFMTSLSWQHDSSYADEEGTDPGLVCSWMPGCFDNDNLGIPCCSSSKEFRLHEVVLAELNKEAQDGETGLPGEYLILGNKFPGPGSVQSYNEG